MAGQILRAVTADPLTGRHAAEARLAELGLPRRRDEYWRYTDPAALIADTPAPLPVATSEDLFAGLDALRLTFVDGRFDAAASDALDLDGVEIDALADAAWAADYYGMREGAAHIPVPRPLAALNTARATDGLAIRVTGHAARPILICHKRSDPAADAIWHHVIRVEADAEATIIEVGAAGARQNSVIEADIAPRGRLHLIAAKDSAHEEVGSASLFAHLEDGSVLKSFQLTHGGRLMRREAVVDMAGDDAVVHLAGAVLGDAADVHHDDTVFVIHGGLRGESRQVFKKVLSQGATGVFQGKILVRPGAQKTDGYQISQALLMDETSQFLAKPELEIYADDVQCSHGSTTGAIDETALFYLRSRGVPHDRAVTLLVLSFLADALAEVEDEDLRAMISTTLEGWLTGEAG